MPPENAGGSPPRPQLCGDWKDTLRPSWFLFRLPQNRGLRGNLLLPLCLIAALIAAGGCRNPAHCAPVFVRSQGTRMMLGNFPFQPRGVNLGNWLVPEPYMMGGGHSNEQIRQALQTAAGSAANFETWRAAWRDNYVTRADIHRIKALGFNTVRVPLDWRDFASGASSVGFRSLDPLLLWCRAEGVYVLPDMHVYPDTVEKGSVFVRSETEGNPDLDLVKAAWVTAARHYRDNSNILGYDLLNEPPGYHDERLRPTYVQIRNAIRTVDTHHLIVIEPNVFSDLGTPGHWFLGKPIDADMVIAPHFYGGDVPVTIDADLPTAANHYNGRKYLSWLYARDSHIPLFVGEMGENSDDWLRRMVRLWRIGKDGITAGVLYWTYKKPGNAGGDLVTVPWTPGWEAIRHYIQDGGTPPPNGYKAMMDMAAATNTRYEVFHPNIANALRGDAPR